MGFLKVQIPGSHFKSIEHESQKRGPKLEKCSKSASGDCNEHCCIRFPTYKGLSVGFIAALKLSESKQ